ncbi:MAG: rhomboid family intramembrane serine protease [Myxococcota bacterium]
MSGGSEPDPVSGWEAIGPATRRKADEWRFVLRAVRIASWVAPTQDGRFALMVRAEQAERALRELSEYEQENRDRLRNKPKRDIPLYKNSWWAVATIAALAIFFSITGASSTRTPYFQVGIADTNAILSGAVHQVVTALTLHADMQHLLGNALVGGLLFAVLHRRFGAGLGSFVVLLSGASGNLMNALWHGADHRSLGASTAVMGALGALAATQFVLNQAREPSRKAVITWAPLVAGAALLGTFGASPTSDLHAHGFGFLAGLVLGIVAAYPIRHRNTPLPIWSQLLFGLLSLAIVGGSWAIAFTFGPITP